mmetsp:Transcript_20689/g.50869  ORF Transcript_20689/g.50869 Transcript_20689/m.50869 type:complete len:374 (-) Transcript_20689:623-1744(-)
MNNTPAKDGDNFRRRRLSLADSMKDAQISEAGSPGGGRERRLSLSPEMGTKSKEKPPFPPDKVGTFSCHGVEPGNRQGESHAKINQDRGGINFPYGPGSKYVLFMVFDGHGANGDKVSQFVVTSVSELLEKKLNEGMPEPEALTKTFLEVDGKLKKDKAIDAELSGTTAVALLYKHVDDTHGKLWAANCGDSRATLEHANGKITDITEDQKPNTPAEQARIIKCGGYVSPPEEEWGGPARVWLDANMTLPGLAMARSLGDHLVDRVGVVAEPVVTTFDIDVTKEAKIVLASDGVWEFIESDQAIKIVNKAASENKKPDATVEVTKLIETAAAKWRQEEGDYRDDITAICVHIPEMHAELVASLAAEGGSGSAS